MKRLIRLVGDSSDISVFSIHGSFFIFPSQHHLARTKKKKLLKNLAHGLINHQIVVIKPYFISFSGLKLF